MADRFSRTQLLYGREAMDYFASCRIAVFGIGGVGGYVVEALARSGIGALDLIDHDKICITNINRQIYATRKTVSKYKVDVAAERIAAKRRENAIQTALHYVRKYDVVVIEDLDMQSMSQSLRLGKSVTDIAFGEFRKWLEWEASKYDCYVLVADKWFASSKTCHDCGYKNNSLKLSERGWVCPKCGARHDRDRNAALNLRGYFEDLYNTAGTAEINACGDFASTLRLAVGRALSLKQEAA